MIAEVFAPMNKPQLVFLYTTNEGYLGYAYGKPDLHWAAPFGYLLYVGHASLFVNKLIVKKGGKRYEYSKAQTKG